MLASYSAMEKFRNYIVPAVKPGQVMFRFENNYGASIIYDDFSYDDEVHQFELVVIYFSPEGKHKSLVGNFDLDYSTDITNDVINGLHPDNVAEILGEIKDLPLKFSFEDDKLLDRWC